MKRQYTILEYDKIIELLAERTSSVLGKETVAGLVPSSDIHEMKRRLSETAEAVSYIMKKGTPGLGDFGNISHAIMYAEKGGSLTFAQLLTIAVQLNAARRAVEFFKGGAAEILADISSVISVHKDFEERITSSIISDTEMSDSASSELRHIRRQIAAQNDNIRTQLNRLVSKLAGTGVLQDQIITQRDGRWVIPVKQESAKSVQGIIHDRSKGGATVFIEPQAVVNANNALRELEIDEAREIDRILAELSAKVAEISDSLRVNQDMLVRIDFIFAKGILACDMKANEPEISNEFVLEIVNGRHPLIAADTVVPISLSLGTDYTTLIITGPNTGGKTVTLKTVGLFVLMAESGLHLPCSRAVIPSVKSVYADIGDEQSIEQSLSTFSSHMKNIVEIVEGADDTSMVFLDELGAGTDPTEGAALAISILEALAAKGSLVLATTHYTELKKYAIATEGVENASMEFDVDTLSPTYKLRVGLPGRSNAFEISRKLGLPEHIVGRAAESMDSGSITFESVIKQADESRQAAETALLEAEQMRAEAEAGRNALEEDMRDFEDKREELWEKAKKDAAEKFADAEEYTEIIRAELKALLDEAGDLIDKAKSDALTAGEAESAPSRGDFYRRLDENRKALRKLDGEFRNAGDSGKSDGSGKKGDRGQRSSRSLRGYRRTPGDEQEFSGFGGAIKKDNIKVGDTVYLMTIGTECDVVTLPDDKDELQILAGRIRMTVKLSDLRSVSGAEKGRGRAHGGSGALRHGSPGVFGSSGSGAARIQFAKASSVSSSFDVHGMSLDDAIMAVDKYIDDATLAGYNTVSVVHGRGEGILRAGLRKMLQSNKHVRKVRTGGPDEGGDGATIVTLK